MRPFPKSNKYLNKKCEYNGIKFDSKKELARYKLLEILSNKGNITELKTQVTFELFPSVPKLFRAIKYIADFTYKNSSGELVVEDAKFFRTKDYIIKQKLMYHVHKIIVKEV